MASLTDEAKEKEMKDTIEEQPENPTNVNETANTTTEESTSTSAASESSKKKKKKKKDSSTTPETQKAEGDNEKDTKPNGNGAKEATAQEVAQNNASVEKESKTTPKDLSSGPVVSVTKRTRPPYKYDPEKVTLRFLFANRDGLTVTVECKPSDTVGEVKGQLLSVWPEGMLRT